VSGARLHACVGGGGQSVPAAGLDEFVGVSWDLESPDTMSCHVHDIVSIDI